MTRGPQEATEDATQPANGLRGSEPGFRLNLQFYVRLVVIALVVIWILKFLRDVGDEFSAAQFALSDLNLFYVVLSASSYLLGLVCFGLFWHLALLAMGQRPTLIESLRSYFLSHLGKYVPSKALVVVIRCDRVSSVRVNRSVAVVGVFIETLGMIAVGGILASSLLIAGYGGTYESNWLILLAIGLAGGSSVGASPPMFRLVLRYLIKRRGITTLGQAIDGLSWRFFFKGWCLAAVGWFFFSVSMILLLYAFTASEGAPIIEPSDYPQVIVAVSLSLVTGFISLLPGGAGVRELVISAILAPVIGPVLAMISAISLRLVWLLCELTAAAGFLVHHRKFKGSTKIDPPIQES
jgi:uncharacterized membrane protein YbhN (UPF0104 family)